MSVKSRSDLVDWRIVVDDVAAPDVDGALTTGHPAEVYQRLLDAGVLALPRCAACLRMHYPPRVLCPHCGSDTPMTWQRPSGRGTVYSTSTLTPRGEAPYVVVLVDLDEGLRLMSNVVDVPADEVKIGMRVEVRVGHRDGVAVPLFVPEAVS